MIGSSLIIDSSRVKNRGEPIPSGLGFGTDFEGNLES